MTNIDRFDQLTGKVFAELYASFPMPMDLSEEMFTDAIVTADSGSEEYRDQVLIRDEFFSSTLNWLIRSGYVSLFEEASRMSNMFIGCTLTAKSLEVLKATPQSLGGESIGAKLQQAAKSGILDSVRSLSNQALSRGVQLATKAAVDFSPPW